MGIQDIIVLLIVSGCLFYVGRNILRFFRKTAKSQIGCGCGCAGCPRASKQKKECPVGK